MTADSIFNAYLDTNIMFLFAACLWALTRFALNRTGLRGAYSSKLQALYGVLTAVVLAPVVIGLHGLSVKAGLTGSALVPSISDYMLAQYLDGRFEMQPTTFEALWTSRTVFTQTVASLESPLAIAAVILGGAGVAFFAARLLRNAMRVRRLIRGSYRLRRFHRVEIRLTDQVDVPFSTRGWRKRYVLLPSALLCQADDLRIAVAHELQHMRQGDLGWEIALEALRPLFFWNPAFAYFKHEVEELRELACDQRVLMRRQFGVDEYCLCLLRVCRNALGHRGSRPVLVPGVQLLPTDRTKRASKFLRRRFLTLLADARPVSGRWVAGVLVLPLVAMISIGSIASQSSGDWSHDRLMLSTIVNLERLDQRTLASQY